VASRASLPEHLKKGSTLKKIIFATLLFCGVCVFGSPQGSAQDTPSQPTAADSTADALTDQQLALLRKDTRSIKKQLIATNLTLTETEATKFWPTYDQYSTETGKINDTRAAIIKEYSDEYGTQTDDQAEALIRRWLETDYRDGEASAKIRADLSKDFAGEENGDFFPTRPAYQHHDRPAAHVATSPSAESGLAEIGATMTSIGTAAVAPAPVLWRCPEPSWSSR